MAKGKGVPIRIGDRTRERILRYDNEAFERLQDETRGVVYPDGMPLGVLINQVQSFNVKILNTTVWVGLLHAEPDLERSQVVRMIDTKRIQEIGEAVGKALEMALPTTRDKEESGEGNVVPAGQ